VHPAERAFLKAAERAFLEAGDACRILELKEVVLQQHNLIEPEAEERHRHPPLLVMPFIFYLEWYTGLGGYTLLASMHFYTEWALRWLPTTAPVK